MPPAITFLVVALLGLAVGSFLNVCIYRLPRGQSVVHPRSRCVQCERRLAWYDNIPLLSYAALGGRCRSCRAHISPIYPAVELSTASVFVLLVWQLGWQWIVLPRAILAAALIVLFAVDLEHRILPNVVTLPGIVVGLIFSLFLTPGVWNSVLGIAVGGGMLLLVAEVYRLLRREEGLGMGDVKMLAMIGAFLGWQMALLALVLASLLGSVIGLAIIAAGKGTLKYPLPFGSFLALAALVSSVAGDAVLGWYLSFY